MHRSLCIYFLVLVIKGAYLQTWICRNFKSKNEYEKKFPPRLFGKICIEEENDVTSKYVCKIWACPPAEMIEMRCTMLNKKKIVGIDGCEVCDGYCSDGGNLFPMKKSWKCSDGSNICSCIRNGQLISTRVKPNRQDMCKKKTVVTAAQPLLKRIAGIGEGR